MEQILHAAQEYWARGFSVIPVNADKTPAINWKAYQGKAMSARQLVGHFKHSNSIALVTGFNGLLCLDFDAADTDKFEHQPYDIVKDFFEPFIDRVQQWLNDDQYAMASSRSGGRHFYVRIQGGVPDSNLKLAYLPATSKTTGKPANKVIIETRGKGGCVVCAPTEGYKWLHGDLQDHELTTITKAQYGQIIELATNYSQVVSKPSFSEPKERNSPTRLSIIDAFNEKYHPSELLARNGYKLVFKGPFINTYLAPDSTSKNAGVRLFHNTDKAMVFSHHANDPLGDDRGHDAFDVFRILEHNSDFDSALQAAREDLGIKEGKAYRGNSTRIKSRHSEQSEEPWGELLEVSEDRVPAPMLTVELIPEPLREWVMSEARELSVHPEYILMPLIASLGGLIAHKFGVYPKESENWCEPTNLWCAVVGEPSTRKSGAIRKATSFAKVINDRAVEKSREERSKRAVEVKTLEAKVKGFDTFLKNQAKLAAEGKNSKDTEAVEEELARIMTELEELKRVATGRFITNDTTTEKLAELIANNSRCFILVLDEIVRLFSSFERKGREGDRAFYLEAFNGNSSYDIDRIMRGEMHIGLLSAVLIGGIQPDRLNKYISDTLDGSNDGFLQRFLLFIWPDKPPVYKYVIEKEDKALAASMQAIFDFFEDIEPATFGLKPYSETGKLQGLHFDDKAQGEFKAWLEELNNTTANEFSNKLAYQAHLGKYPKLCTTLALIFHLLSEAVRGDEVEPSNQIGIESLLLAIDWCKFLKHHASKLYFLELNAELTSALALMDRIEDGDVKDGDTIKSIYNHHWKELGTKEEVISAIAFLERYNYTREEESKPMRGRPSRVIRIHPDFREI